MSSNARFKKILVLSGMALLSLTACQANPTSVPAGYTWHQGAYNSPPGEKPDSIGYEWSGQKNAESAAHWRVAARDIVSRIVAEQGVSAVPVYVMPSRARTPFTATFDNFLREELIRSGFVVAATPGKGPVLRYDAAVVDHKAVRKLVESGEVDKTMLPASGNEVVVNVNVTGGGQVLAEVTGVYTIPEAASYNYREPVIKSLPIAGRR